MPIDKKLALAFDFKSAPAEVQKAGELHRDNWLRLEKANIQLQKWKEEKAAAQKEYDASQAGFDSSISAWDPAGSLGAAEEKA